MKEVPPDFYCEQFINEQGWIYKSTPCKDQCHDCMDKIIDHHFNKKKSMKELRTPEEIILENADVHMAAVGLLKQEIVNVIKAAQREALEAAAENAKVKYTRNGFQSTSTTSNKDLYDASVDKDSILNLLKP